MKNIPAFIDYMNDQLKTHAALCREELGINVSLEVGKMADDKLLYTAKIDGKPTHSFPLDATNMKTLWQSWDKLNDLVKAGDSRSAAHNTVNLLTASALGDILDAPKTEFMMNKTSKAHDFAETFNTLIENMKAEYIPEKSFSFPCPATATALSDDVVNFSAKSPHGYFGLNVSVKLDDPESFKAKIAEHVADFEPEECARAVYAANRLSSVADADKCSEIFRAALLNEEMLQKFEEITCGMVDEMVLVGIADQFFENVPTKEEQVTSLEALIASAENTPNANSPAQNERSGMDKDER